MNAETPMTSPSQPTSPSVDALAKAIRGALIEDWKNDVDGSNWREDVLLTGCKKAGGGFGYHKPEEAAQNLALDAANAVLALSVPRSPSVDAERHPGPWIGADAELARACTMVAIKDYGNDDSDTHQRILKDGVWNDHVAVQAALAAIHSIRKSALSVPRVEPVASYDVAFHENVLDKLEADKSSRLAAPPSHPDTGERETLGSRIRDVYGSLDAEDCKLIDREWARQRGYILPTDGMATLSVPRVEPVAFTNKAQLGFLKDSVYAEIPMAMWGKKSATSNVPLYASPPSQPDTREELKSFRAKMVKLHNDASTYEGGYAVSTSVLFDLVKEFDAALPPDAGDRK